MRKTKIYRLPKKFADKWLGALRSGDYKQAEGQLMLEHEGEKSYCCLGVACEIAGHTRNIVKHGNDGYVSEKYFRKVPNELLEDNSLTTFIAGMNDDDGLSFEEIADWLEENVEFYE